jgi:hypothetical protein
MTNVAAAYLVVATDSYLSVDPGVGFTITLPLSPVAGMKLHYKNRTDSLVGVTVSGNGKTIDGAASIVVAAARASFDIAYNSSTNDWETS